jgi:hypothetical protein
VSDRPNLALVIEYFARGDAGRADLLDLFDEQVEFYFPKFGRPSLRPRGVRARR